MSKRGKKTGCGCLPYFSGLKEESDFFWAGVGGDIFLCYDFEEDRNAIRTACHAEFGADLATFAKNNSRKNPE